MTKGELLRAIEGLDDETELVVWAHGRALDIIRTRYVPAQGRKDAFVHLVACPADTSTAAQEPK